jgi:2-polyprenyl-3-methyl-5-hydroxy-6-metoxy-1,4-benzoquinol methylase
LDPDFARSYRDLYERHWWFRAREALILEILRREMPEGGRNSILDVGCGDGLFFESLQEFGNVEGVEPFADGVSPNNPHRNSIHIGSFDAQFQPRKKYTLILMLDVLEHLDNPLEALQHAHSLLSPDGSILITVPAFSLLWTSHDRLNHHRIRYTLGSLKRVVRDASFQVVMARYFFFWLFAAKLATRIKESLFGATPTIPGLPPVWVNRLLHGFSRAEESLLGRLPIPFGGSVLLLGRAHFSQSVLNRDAPDVDTVSQIAR